MYKSLMQRYREQSPREIFAHFLYRGRDGETWETPYQKLADDMAKDEEWNFRKEKYRRHGQNFPILTNYLNYTFLRVQDLGLIAYSPDKQRACFNTGLQTQNEKDIFAAFARNEDAEARNITDWRFHDFLDSYSDQLSYFRPLPEIATYITDPSDLVFDTSFHIEVNYEHIFDENHDRLPEALKGNRVLAIAAIQGSVQLLKEKVRRNYKTAIPHWYNGRMQLLLPLNLTSPDEADLALVADKDASRQLYKIKTALSMDMAYIDARLITRPDRDWLNP